MTKLWDIMNTHRIKRGKKCKFSIYFRSVGRRSGNKLNKRQNMTIMTAFWNILFEVVGKPNFDTVINYFKNQALYVHHRASKDKNNASENDIFESEKTQRKNRKWVIHNRDVIRQKGNFLKKGNLSICDVKNMSKYDRESYPIDILILLET